MADANKRPRLTKIKVVFKSSSYFFIKSRSYSSVSRWNLSYYSRFQRDLEREAAMP